MFESSNKVLGEAGSEINSTSAYVQPYELPLPTTTDYGQSLRRTHSTNEKEEKKNLLQIQCAPITLSHRNINFLGPGNISDTMGASEVCFRLFTLSSSERVKSSTVTYVDKCGTSSLSPNCKNTKETNL